MKEVCEFFHPINVDYDIRVAGANSQQCTFFYVPIRCISQTIRIPYFSRNAVVLDGKKQPVESEVTANL